MSERPADADPVDDHFETLLNELLPLALDQLEEHGEFYPFAGQLYGDGRFEVVLGASEDDLPDPEAVVEDLLDLLRGVVLKEDVVAVGIAMDVKTEDPESGAPVDAVALDLEHRTGPALSSFVAHHKLPDGQVEDGELWACEGERRVFPA